jgi:oligoribonuclease
VTYGVPMLAFTDLETTGLVAAKCAVLEVAVVVTDDELRKHACFERVIYHHQSPYLSLVDISSDEQVQSASSVTGIDPVVIKMHGGTGLWSASAASPFRLESVDADLAAFLDLHARGAQLAGNTINFDRAFMQVHLPQAHAVLHYRNFDCSTLNEFARRFCLDVYDRRPKLDKVAHRSMTDALDSLSLARYYRDHLVAAPAGDAADPDAIR